MDDTAREEVGNAFDVAMFERIRAFKDGFADAANLIPLSENMTFQVGTSIIRVRLSDEYCDGHRAGAKALEAALEEFKRGNGIR